MSSTLARKVRYLKERCVNAYWMLRGGKFKLILQSICIELGHRIADIRDFLFKARELDSSRVPDSAFINMRKVVPPSYRPTTSRLAAPTRLQADSKVVENELRRILSTLAIIENVNS